MDMTPQTWPDWYDGRHINEVLFCQQFLEKHPMKCVRGRLFTVDGLIEDEGQIGNLILEEISGVLTSGLSKVVINLLASIKLQAYSPPLPIETDRMLHHILLHIPQAGSQCFGFFTDIQQGNFADAAGKIFGSQVGVLTDQHGAAQLADFFFQRKFFQQCRSPLARRGGDKAVGDVHG